MLLAIIYSDLYLRETQHAQIEIYQLIGIVCLMLAVKMQEDVVLTQEQACSECSQNYSQEMMMMVEQDIVFKLGF